MSKSNGRYPKIIHAQTEIKTVFMLIDKDGNAIDRRVIQAEIYKLESESFGDALRQLKDHKKKLEQEVKDG